MTKIVICGIAGRMGQRLAHLTLTAADLELCGGKERPNHEAVGTRHRRSSRRTASWPNGQRHAIRHRRTRSGGSLFYDPGGDP